MLYISGQLECWILELHSQASILNYRQKGFAHLCF